ncbi:MAG: Uncharacterized protein G01um101420_860 [Parcubacteria group bacterium Gr01-1014_20]|nr:MAG: Uncharacterized protein G01um101420_860 [Parcubacteria group bacterium Gr01-1014_20]
MEGWKTWFRKIFDKNYPGRKIVGVILIALGFLALITPLTPGSWLIFVGLGFLGIRLTIWDRIKSWFLK